MRFAYGLLKKLLKLLALHYSTRYKQKISKATIDSNSTNSCFDFYLLCLAFILSSASFMFSETLNLTILLISS